jgi:hypothetical protein
MKIVETGFSKTVVIFIQTTHCYTAEERNGAMRTSDPTVNNLFIYLFVANLMILSVAQIIWD